MVDLNVKQKRKCNVNLEHSIMPERKEFSKNDGDISEGHRSQLEGALTSQNWSNMNIRIMKTKEQWYWHPWVCSVQKKNCRVQGKV